MTYAADFLKVYGERYTILRDPSVESYLSKNRSTRAVRDLGSRDAYYEGITLASTNLVGGEIIQVGDEKYLVQGTMPDPATDELVLFIAKTNIEVAHQRKAETVDGDGNIILSEWDDLHTDIPAFGEAVTYALRQQDPGLLPSTRYVIQIPRYLGVKKLDRIVFYDSNYQVEAVDDVMLKGIVKCQLSFDRRP